MEHVPDMPGRVPSEVIEAQHHPMDDDDKNDNDVKVPFEINEESFPIPVVCEDDENATPQCASATWAPGKKLIVAYVTWNMAQKDPVPHEISSYCVRPNAHIVVVSTQENGPYVGLNDKHREWERLLDDIALQGKYHPIAAQTLWAIHLMVFVRKRDVAAYVREVHIGIHKTGAVKGTCGNKGGVAVALTVSLRRSTALRALSPTQLPRTDVSDEAVLNRNEVEGNPMFSPRDAQEALTQNEELFRQLKTSAVVTKATPSEMRLLFIGAHLTAHQHNVAKRNEDYASIVRNLPVGSLGPFRGKYSSRFDGAIPYSRRDGNGDDAQPQSLATSSCEGRDVTEEFDFCFFGGDLNYRLNGTKKAIEFIVNHRKSLRSVLVNNDQLLGELKKGVVFHGFQEQQLHFRPTYKYHLENGVSTDDYDCSKKKPRMPAYCDRVLYKYKRRAAASAKEGGVEPVVPLLYTDCTGVRSSDHRPVVAMFAIETTMILDEPEDYEEPLRPEAAPCCL